MFCFLYPLGEQKVERVKNCIPTSKTVAPPLGKEKGKDHCPYPSHYKTPDLAPADDSETICYARVRV